MSVLATNYLTPTGREEAWRFTPLKRLAGLHDNSTKVIDHISIAAKSTLPKGVSLLVADASDYPPSYTSTDVVTNRVRQEVKKISVLTIANDLELTESIYLSRNCSTSPEVSRILIQACVS